MQHIQLFYGSLDRTTGHRRVALQKALAHNAGGLICYHIPADTPNPAQAT